jgi:hypothetical protein
VTVKKVFAAALAILLISASTPVVAYTPGQGGSREASPPASMIDNIEVPFDVIEYVQGKYLGYAVTRAEKITRDGKQVYRLLVDRDDITTDYTGFYLLYDASWKLIGEEKMTAPPKPAVRTQSTDTQKKTQDQPPQPQPAPSPAVKPGTDTQAPLPTGGSGGGTTATDPGTTTTGGTGGTTGGTTTTDPGTTTGGDTGGTTTTTTP